MNYELTSDELNALIKANHAMAIAIHSPGEESTLAGTFANEEVSRVIMNIMIRKNEETGR
jgi:hypothetical protein